LRCNQLAGDGGNLEILNKSKEIKKSKKSNNAGPALKLKLHNDLAYSCFFLQVEKKCNLANDFGKTMRE
jgi:hypothetical protein